MEKVYENLIRVINECKEEMIQISSKIHDYSELGFEEHRSSELLAGLLEKYGFEVQHGVGSLKTAFKAVYHGKGRSKAVAFLAEYDALPGVGHGCGHNLIGATSIFAAVALTKVLKDFDGDIVVMGTPAEETGGGKIILLDEGAFKGVGYSIMAHPASINEVGRTSRAITGIFLEYFGKSAHSSAPEYGINALKAVINTFNGIDLISQTFPSGVNTNGIIVDGGEADNIIPGHASCKFTVRAETQAELLGVLEKIKKVVESTEMLTGARAHMEIEPIYAERRPNMTMELRFKEHLEALGETVSVANPKGKYGSSDIGNVSLVMPVIHAYYKIMDEPVNAHSKEFAQKAVTDEAFNGMVKASQALAMLGADLLTDSDFRRKADEEFKGKE